MAVTKPKTQEAKAQAALKDSRASTSEPKALQSGGSKAGQAPSPTSEVLKLLQIITDPTRSRIIQSLAEGEKTVKELCSLAGGSQPATSHHLALLRNAGVVTRQRQGNKDVYVLTEQGSLLAKFKVATKVRSEVQERLGAKSLGIDPALLDDVAGIVEDPVAWFTTPNVVFEGRKPIDLLGTKEEARLRNRIEMAKLGMFS